MKGVFFIKETIEFKKDCMLKTYVSSISDISITHDYKVLDDVVEGYFDVTGSYKQTLSSVENEEFFYTIPFTIALSSLIDKDSINISIHDFNYELEKDILHLKMTLDMEYEKVTINEEVNESIDNLLEEKELLSPVEFHDEVMLDDKVSVLPKEEKLDDNINKVFSSTMSESFSKYKVYIVREEDTLDSILFKYKVTLDDIKEYNDIDNIKVHEKIIIPVNINEQS